MEVEHKGIRERLAPNVKVVVRHYRRYSRGRVLSNYRAHELGVQDSIKRTGGMTTVNLMTKDNVSLGNGVAWCSTKDAYCRQTGFDIALERAVVDAVEWGNSKTVFS